MVIHSHGISGKKVAFDLAALQAINIMLDKVRDMMKYFEEKERNTTSLEYSEVARHLFSTNEICVFLGKITDGVKAVEAAYGELVTPDDTSEEDKDNTNN